MLEQEKSSKRKKEFEKIISESLSSTTRFKRNKDRILTFSKYMMLTDLMGFFYKGYKKDRYYWELLIFVKKVIFTFIAVIT